MGPDMNPSTKDSNVTQESSLAASLDEKDTTDGKRGSTLVDVRDRIGLVRSDVTLPGSRDDAGPGDCPQHGPTEHAIHFSNAERRKIVRKIDIRLLAVFCLMYISIQTDRANLSNAVTDNFLGDLNLTTSDFNIALAITRVSFMLAELPVQCLIVRYSFRNIFPWMMMAWGVASAMQGFIASRAALFTTRALIGALEGGFMPGVTFLFTQFYTTAELTPRLAVLASCQDLSIAIASLLAAGLLHMRGVAGRPGWFWLFALEGVWVFVTGIVAWLYLPKSPYETRSIICPKGWFSEREQAILEHRLVRDDPSKRRTGRKTKTSMRVLLSTFRDSHLWIFFLLSVLAVMLNSPMKAYLGLTLRRMEFSTLDANLLSAPAAALTFVSVLILALSSEFFKERTWHCVFAALWNLPCFIALVLITPGAGDVQTNAWGRYVLATLIAGSPTMYPILLSWISALSCTVETRATNIATVSTLSLLGAVLSTQLYAERDEPFYKGANRIEIGLCGLTAVLLVVQRFIFARLNRINASKDDETKANGGPAQVQADDGHVAVQADDGHAEVQADDGHVAVQVDDEHAEPRAEDKNAEQQADDRHAEPQADDKDAEIQADDRDAEVQADHGHAEPQADDKTAGPQADDKTAGPQADGRDAEVQADHGHADAQADLEQGPVQDRDEGTLDHVKRGAPGYTFPL